MLETAQDKGRVEQAVLELRRELQAVSIGPAPFLGCAVDFVTEARETALRL